GARHRVAAACRAPARRRPTGRRTGARASSRARRAERSRERADRDDSDGIRGGQRGPLAGARDSLAARVPSLSRRNGHADRGARRTDRGYEGVSLPRGARLGGIMPPARGGLPRLRARGGGLPGGDDRPARAGRGAGDRAARGARVAAAGARARPGVGGRAGTWPCALGMARAARRSAATRMAAAAPRARSGRPRDRGARRAGAAHRARTAGARVSRGAREPRPGPAGPGRRRARPRTARRRGRQRGRRPREAAAGPPPSVALRPRGLGDVAELAAELAQVLRVLGAEPGGKGRRVVAAIALMALAGLAQPAAAQTLSAEALYDAGALRAAADSFAARAAAEPRVPAHWYNLGATLYRAGADGKATAAWARAARLAPRDPLVRRARELLPAPDAASEALLTTGFATPGEWALGAGPRWVAMWIAVAGRRRRSVAAVTATIAVLPPQVADQIAAGEVVERPASVVKELIENALDAGASAIRIDIEDGGKSLIRVSDDGAGMSRPDTELALSRHATSKIREAVDLIGVATFGFRGEALPAIASVSRFELETSTDGHVATHLRVTGGKRESVDDAARQRGTTVTVRGLFFNTPARRKFLRAQATETRAAVEVVTLLALSRPDVAFTLTSDDRSLIDVRPTTRPIDRVHALWGPQLAGTLLPIAYREGPLEVRGFAQRPAQAKPAGRKGYVFVRGRPIRD